MRFQILLLILFVFCSVQSFADAPIFKFTAKIVDSSGNPIAGANAFATFTGSKAKVVKGQTDNQGYFEASGATTPICGVTIEKNGYYMSGYSFENMIVRQLKSDKKSMLTRWEPWNPKTEIILKKKNNPIPMYVGVPGGHIEIPVFSKPVGYDLEKKDWVVPYGEGIVKDFIFVFTVSDKDANSWEEWHCSYKLTFSNKMDGIQEYYSPENNHSEYIWPYKAPEKGYQSVVTNFNSMKKTPEGTFRRETSYAEERSYIFRIRTKIDKNGNIEKAKYGKIRGEIRQGLKTISFNYYLNPTGTRNLEYSGQNLFTSDNNKYLY